MVLRQPLPENMANRLAGRYRVEEAAQLRRCAERHVTSVVIRSFGDGFASADRNSNGVKHQYQAVCSSQARRPPRFLVPNRDTMDHHP